MATSDKPANEAGDAFSDLHAQVRMLAEENALLRTEVSLHADRGGLIDELREANENLLLASVQAQNLRDDAMAANRRQDEFLAMLAHELRNPLEPISLASTLMARLPSPSPQLADLQAIIARQVSHLSRLLDDLLDAARINSGKISLVRAPVSLRELIGRAVDAVQVRMMDRRQELNLSLPDAMLIEADAVRMIQVFANLLVNATKFTADAGSITITGVERDGFATVSIADTGIGIAPEALPHIFDLFTQGPRSLARSEGGLGVGLNVVRNIVQLHGGEVSASSEPGLPGASFTVRLPLAEVAAPVPVRIATSAATTSPRRILLVEDNFDASMTLSSVLEAEGHTVKVAFDGVGGLARASEETFDILICDIGLPGIDGFELLTQLRASTTHPIPFAIAVSGYGQADYRTRAIVAGYGQYFIKPVDIDALLALIASATVSGFIAKARHRR